MLYAHTCAHIAPAEIIRMRISIIVSTFKIPLWNLRREQQISRHVTSAWYPIFRAIFQCHIPNIPNGRESPWTRPWQRRAPAWISPHLPHPPAGCRLPGGAL